MQILLANDTGNRANLGCQLTSRTLAKSLLDAFASGESAPTLRSAPWGFAPHLQLRERASRNAFSTGRGLLSEPVLRDIAVGEYGEEALEAARSADVVAFQPEGTISDDHGALRILRNLSLPLWVALHGERPLVVTNGTFPLFKDLRADLIHLLLERAAYAALRDRISAAHWGVPFAPDTAVLWPRRPEGATTLRDHLLLTTGAEVEAARDLAIGRAALEVCRRSGLRPLVLTKGWKRFASFRSEVEALGGTFLEQVTLDQADAWLDRCRLHMGGRYHMALMCATKGVPSALVRTNTHKNLWLAQDFSGIDLAPDEAGLATLGEAMLARPVPDDKLLADVERHRALQQQEMERLSRAVSAPPSHGSLPDPAPALLAALRREARADLRPAWLQRLLGRH